MYVNPQWRDPGDRLHEPPDWWLNAVAERASTTRRSWVLRHLIGTLIAVIRLLRDRRPPATADSDSMVEASVECPSCGASIRATTAGRSQ